MVCKIAEQYFTNKTMKAVLDLLPESAGGELSTMCPWADQVRFKYHWSSPLHFVDTPGVCNYKYSILCDVPVGGPGEVQVPLVKPSSFCGHSWSLQLQVFK
ncbi:uncharacterized protein A4U43_C01F29720 [Asparagus officinalis]|uniref:Aspergillus nuclease S1 n=1 Tax=Asparagus officinalis TaxID=4686 RepID=A0A5P1FU37_ASPOF|nr:uncharacterized protein A4U43_C01F29720 [Asparagus officinalis]